MGFHQSDGAPTKTASCDATSPDAGGCAQRLHAIDDPIQFDTGNIIVVPQRRMTGVKELPELLHVMVPNGTNGLLRPVDFRNHVLRSLVLDSGQLGFLLFNLFEGDGSPGCFTDDG